MSSTPLPAHTPAVVHPWAPRFAQAITGVLCLEAVLFQTWPVVAVALALVLLALVGPRYSPVAWLFRLLPVRPAELEPSAPVRFAQLLAVVMLGVALILLIAGLDVAGWIITGMVAAVALLSAISGVCIGCIAWKQMVRRGGRARDLRSALDLTGIGPWLVLVTAPNCPHCGPAAAAIRDAAGDRPVVRVDLAEHPEAGALPIRSVPAALIVGGDGEIGLVRTGRIGAKEARELVAALS